MQTGWKDTIAALATPPGVGAIGVIRVSGKDSFPVINQLFPSKDLEEVPSHTLHVGHLKEDNEVIDEVVLAIFRGPKSYTGEDVIEISCHGSFFIQQQILNILTSKGIRIAKPGEFTLRAFLNGKMDLAQAEAVADLIASNTEASRRTAIQNLRGGFSNALQQVRDEMLSFSALIELELDFSQEDVEFADRTRFYELLKTAEEKVQHLLYSFKLGNVIKNGVQVAIVGKPNAGKSTLLNALLNEDRAIVSDIAGTTRDTIEEQLNINGILFRLVDTAGIREHTDDVIEALGVERSMEKMKHADIVIYLFDISTITSEEIHSAIKQFKKAGSKYLLVANKTDRLSAEEHASWKNFPVVFISASRGENINELKQSLFEMSVENSLLGNDVIITNARHVDALNKVQESISEIKAGLDNSVPGDLLALDIRRCLHFLGEITGTITNEDQLDYIFSKFCIGK
ncbi:MAG: mnmE [Chitinophagaceae bacterium]|nr:mnmE [Chitinophagaceae bacterium]